MYFDLLCFEKVHNIVEDVRGGDELRPHTQKTQPAII